MNRPGAPHFVYRCFDGDQLLYIGATQNVPTRLAQLTALCNVGRHPATGTLIRRMTHHTSESYPSRSAAFAAERAAIGREAPLLNVNSQSGGRRMAGLVRVGSEDDR